MKTVQRSTTVPMGRNHSGTYSMLGGVAFGSMGETAPEVLGVPVPALSVPPKVTPYQKIFDHSPPGAAQKLHLGVAAARRAVQTKNFKLALKILKDIMEAYPGSKEARLAEVEYQHIKELMHKAHVAGDVSKSLIAARTAIHFKHYEKALGILDNIVSIYPASKEAQFARIELQRIGKGLAAGHLVEGVR